MNRVMEEVQQPELGTVLELFSCETRALIWASVVAVTCPPVLEFRPVMKAAH